MPLRLGSVALLLAFTAAPGVVAAAPTDDGYIEGDAAAALEREFSLAAPSLRVRHGVVTIAAADLATVDQARVLARLERPQGVERVEVRQGSRPGCIQTLERQGYRVMLEPAA